MVGGKASAVYDGSMAAVGGDRNKVVRVGAVSFLNTKPLTEALVGDPRFDVRFAVPSLLAGMLDRGEVDVALVPVIDLIRGERRLEVVSDACIGCDGATLTVRVFSRVDPADVTVLHVDVDSHSSAALASIVWRERFGRKLELIPIDTGGAGAAPGTDAFRECQAVLLIGDKVIRPPDGLDVFSTQVDLGAAWKSMTGLPFVFAVWASTAPHVAWWLSRAMSAARDCGVARAGEIAEREGARMGWPIDLARRYLTEYLTFTMTARHRDALHRFLVAAGKVEPLLSREVSIV
ncbi:MAG: menaquinone biosynthesis protein [Phycisphaerales bacterium]|nr:menaquinone biosynthesis protein [Phycisphaerales bacterium]